MASSTSLPLLKRRSLFDEEEIEEDTPATKSKPLSIYEKRLSIEIKDWNESVINAEKSKMNKFEVDKSCLTESEKQFLENAPNFDDIIKTSNAHCKKLEFFLNILEKKKELEDMKMDEKEAFINTKVDDLINIVIDSIPDIN